MSKTIFNIIQSNVIGGGMENIFLEYSKIISRQKNINLICIVSKKFCHIEALKKQNIQVEILNIKGHFDILAALKLRYLIKKYSAKVVLAHNGRCFAAINLCKNFFGLKSVKTIAVSHGGVVKRILNFDYIICVAKHIQEKIDKNNPKAITKTIYNGYKISPFSKNYYQKNNFVFGALSRLSKEKNLTAAIEMFKKFNDEVEKNSLLIIAGEGEERADLEELTAKYNLQERVKFIGWVQNKEEFFNQIDVFLQPALSEPFGITILESFNYKTPVIACDSFGPKEIITNDYSGYLFDSNDEKSLFLTMRKSYLQKDWVQMIAENAGKDLKEKFSYEIMEKKLLEFIEEIPF